MNENSYPTITCVIDYLRDNPELFFSNGDNITIKIVFKDLRKRFTEFYRIQVIQRSSSKVKAKFFWVRIVKNKSIEKIREALQNQHDIMERLYHYLSSRNSEGIDLLCSKPLILLHDMRALITEECRGQLFNTYLRRQLPIIKQKEIINHCFNVGIWLRHFHHCFRNPAQSHNMTSTLIKEFRHRFGREPVSEKFYITYCHNDYSPRNIFVSKDSVDVIDFVGAKPGFPESDLFFFTNYIKNAKFNFLYSQQLKRQMIKAYQTGYDKAICTDLE